MVQQIYFWTTLVALTAATFWIVYSHLVHRRYARLQKTYSTLMPHVQLFGFYRNLGPAAVTQLATEWTETRLPLDRKIVLIQAGFLPAAAKSPHAQIITEDQAFADRY